MTPNDKAMPDNDQWLVWSNEHNAWWRPHRAGYSDDLRGAGLYSHGEAHKIVEQASVRGRGLRVPEAAVTLTAALESWNDPGTVGAVLYTALLNHTNDDRPGLSPADSAG